MHFQVSNIPDHYWTTLNVTADYLDVLLYSQSLRNKLTTRGCGVLGAEVIGMEVLATCQGYNLQKETQTNKTKGP